MQAGERVSVAGVGGGGLVMDGLDDEGKVGVRLDSGVVVRFPVGALTPEAAPASKAWPPRTEVKGSG